MRGDKKKEKTVSSGKQFNEMMNAEEHRQWKKGYDAQMKAKRKKVGYWDSTKGKRMYD